MKYEEQAEQFLKATQTKFSYELVGTVQGFPNDNRDQFNRYHFEVTLSNARHSFTFFFYGSHADWLDGEETLSAYDVLSTITKNEPESDLRQFASAFGYDWFEESTERIYKAVKKEWENICQLFNDKEIEMLQEIQ
jgi:hypothetical protein